MAQVLFSPIRAVMVLLLAVLFTVDEFCSVFECLGLYLLSLSIFEFSFVGLVLFLLWFQVNFCFVSFVAFLL